MAIRFIELHPTPNEAELNGEWIVLHNDGQKPFHTRGCGMTVSRLGSTKKSQLGIMDPGFLLAPGAKIRMCTGGAGTEAHGKPPDDSAEGAIKNYHLFLPKPILREPGTILTLTLRGLVVSKIEFDPAAPGGCKPVGK